MDEQKHEQKIADAARKLIEIDRGKFRATLYERERAEVRFYEAGRWRIAVGALGTRTPHGVYVTHSKVKDPDWQVPASQWAIDLGLVPGTIVAGGSDENPLKARWIGVTEPRDGVGIHGTGNIESIGTAASHGCVRMRVEDVIELYEQVPIGTPIVVF